MNTQHVDGITVVSINAGERLGAVSSILLDSGGRATVALGVASNGGDRWLAAADVRAIGPDALTVEHAKCLQAAPPTIETLDLVSVLKRKVVTEGGVFVGHVASAELDDDGLGVTHWEVSPGFFKSNKLVPIDQVVNIGGELMMVTDDVCADAPDENPSAQLAADSAVGSDQPSAPLRRADKVPG